MIDLRAKFQLNWPRSCRVMLLKPPTPISGFPGWKKRRYNDISLIFLMPYESALSRWKLPYMSLQDLLSKSWTWIDHSDEIKLIWFFYPQKGAIEKRTSHGVPLSESPLKVPTNRFPGQPREKYTWLTYVRSFSSIGLDPVELCFSSPVPP